MRDRNRITDNTLFMMLRFVSYLWGIETPTEIVTPEEGDEFVSYLWGIETALAKKDWKKAYEVCILPMRDWNQEQLQQRDQQLEVCILPMRDWNRNTSRAIICSASVCILPMRDWNFHGVRIVLRSYCCLYLTYEGSKLALSKKFFKLFIRVCILPMRDRNLMGTGGMPTVRKSLYLTYEGLKHWLLVRWSLVRICLYLTYEGLKPPPLKLLK